MSRLPKELAVEIAEGQRQQLNTAPKFFNIDADIAWLVCPKCDEYYLHQKKVTVEASVSEDTEVEIVFECECCDFKGALSIANRKGNTTLLWLGL